MSRRREESRVCRLIYDSLAPYMELDLNSLPNEKEKDVLIVLSQVLRHIQLLKDGDDSVHCITIEGSGCTEPSFGDHHCLTKVIACLIVLLTVKSQFVRHSAKNVLVSVSKLVALSGGKWKCFIQLLCICLELLMSSILSYAFDSSIAGMTELSHYMKTFDVIIKPRLANANWPTVSCIIDTLRDILKYLKQDYDVQLLATYFDCVSSCLSNIQWDFLNQIHFQRSSCKDSLSLFLGNLVQFFCSLVEQSNLVEERGVSPGWHQIVANISTLIPEILSWCLGNHGGHNNLCISPYFTHKLLMLMIRLSSQTCRNYSSIVTWLQLLHKYFQVFLLQSLTELESGDKGCLEGSPFAPSICDRNLNSMGTRHIQRQAIFLFLRCSFSLISLNDDTDKLCTCKAWDSRSPYDLSSDLECCNKKKGLLELYHWLEGHLPSNIFVDHNIYKENCNGFAQSFLQLYINEDDILFEVLLLLFSVTTYCAEQRLYEDTGTWKKVKKDILHHISNIFHPIFLFHLFLAELHYDHHVLLDYLISKDTGISCAEYLLRCLRTVCSSWHLFVEFSWSEEDLSKASYKKRKVILNAPNSREKQTYVTVQADVSFSDEEHGTNCYTTREQPFKEAKDCLLSLKTSIANLSQKNLFPYNPEVLLRRLRRFQELC